MFFVDWYAMGAAPGILGFLPNTIGDDWIEKDLRNFIRPESPVDVFSLRYGDFLEVEGRARLGGLDEGGRTPRR
jgi:hypothetical protein